MPLQAWLPDSALHGGAVDRALGDVALRWSEKWFSRQLLGLVEPSSEPAGADAVLSRRVHDAGAIVSVADRGQLALAGLLLDVAIESLRSTTRDRAFLHDLAEICMDDLCSGIGQSLGFANPAEWRRADAVGRVPTETTRVCLGVHTGAPVVEILVERQAAVALIKKQAPTGGSPRPLQPLADALALQPIEVGALVGCCELSLGDFAQLERGDVIVLDHELAEPLALSLDRGATCGRCTVEQTDSALSIKIIKPLRG
jgi:flagellar motor switch/type III secretory pathway protein FliN